MNDHTRIQPGYISSNKYAPQFIFWGDIAKKVDGLSDVWAYPTESFSFEFSTPLNLSLTPICSFDSPAL